MKEWKKCMTQKERWVDVFRCFGWNVKAGVLGEAQLVMSDSPRFESHVSSSHMPLSSELYPVILDMREALVCVETIKTTKTHMGHTEMKHRKVWTGKPRYLFFSLVKVNMGFIILFKADVLHIHTAQAWGPLQENLLANAESNLAKRRPLGGLRILSYAYVHRRLGDRASLSRSLNVSFITACILQIFQSPTHILKRFEKEEGNGAGDMLKQEPDSLVFLQHFQSGLCNSWWKTLPRAKVQLLSNVLVRQYDLQQVLQGDEKPGVQHGEPVPDTRRGDQIKP